MSYLCSHGVLCIQQTSTNAALRESLKPFSTDVLCMDCLPLTLVFGVLKFASEGLLSDETIAGSWLKEVH